MTTRSKLIVIEGPDCTGKTTLATHLARELGFKYAKFSNPVSRESAHRAYVDWLKAKQPNTVLDRSWLGEFAYGPLFRKYPVDYMDELEELIAANYDILYILSVPTREWAAKHSDNRGEPPYRNNDIVKAGGLYDELLEKFIRVFNNIQVGSKFLINPENYVNALQYKIWGLNIAFSWLKGANFYRVCDPMYALTYFNPMHRFVLQDEWTRMMVDFTCNCGHFKDHKQYPFYKQWERITWGVGNVANPKVIFVGEAPGMHGCGTTGIPFYFDRSGFLLKWLLFKYGIAESEYYITNICKCTPRDNKINLAYADICGRRHLVKELKSIGGGTIVALGRTAQNWLEQADIQKAVGYGKVHFIYHPAWALRKGAEAEYESMFSDLIRDVNFKRRMLPI